MPPPASDSSSRSAAEARAAASRLRLFGSTASAPSASTPAPTPTPRSTTTSSSSIVSSSRLAPASKPITRPAGATVTKTTSTAPSSSSTVTKLTKPLPSSTLPSTTPRTRPTASTNLHKTPSTSTSSTSQLTSTRPTLSKVAPLSISAPSSSSSTLSLTSPHPTPLSKSTTAPSSTTITHPTTATTPSSQPTLSIPPTTRTFRTQPVPGTPQPTHQLSAEARDLLATIDSCQSTYLNPNFLSIEDQCVLLRDELYEELQQRVETGQFNQDMVDRYQQLLITAQSQYALALDTIHTQHEEHRAATKAHFDQVSQDQQQHLATLQQQFSTQLADFTTQRGDLEHKQKELSSDCLRTTKETKRLESESQRNADKLTRLTTNLALSEAQKNEIFTLRDKINQVADQKSLFENSQQVQVMKQREYDEQTSQFIAAEVYRRQLHNLLQDIRGSIRVLCRIRPLMKHDNETEYKTLRFEPEVSKLKLSIKNEVKTFDFETILGPDSTQSDVFEEVSGIVQSAIDGYNVCLFSYGLTGSGKSHTMTGKLDDNEMKGIIPRAVDLIFAQSAQLNTQGWKFEAAVSCCQIYKEQLTDLLEPMAVKQGESKPSPKVLKLQPDPVQQKMHVDGLLIRSVNTPRDVHNCLFTATSNRAVAKTSMNSESSRSHFIFTLHVTMTNTKTGETRTGALNLCDLAGSERISRAKTTGEQQAEGKQINLSLTNLGIVFLKLSEGSSHIPVRNSQLTQLLQYCLTGNGKTMMIVNLSPTTESAPETLSSLTLAKTVASIEKAKGSGHGGANKGAKAVKRKEMSADGGDNDGAGADGAKAKMTGRRSLTTGGDGNKRMRVQSSQNSSSSSSSMADGSAQSPQDGDNDDENDENGDNSDEEQQLVCLQRFQVDPLPFSIDSDILCSFSEDIQTLNGVIAELSTLCEDVTAQRQRVDEAMDAIATARVELKPMSGLSLTNSTANSMSNSTDNAAQYATTKAQFTAKLRTFQSTLSALRQSVRCSTMELAVKGQRLQFDNLERDLKIHVESITTMVDFGTNLQSSLSALTITLTNILTTLQSIHQTMVKEEAKFEEQIDTMTNELDTEQHQLTTKFNMKLSAANQAIQPKFTKMQKEIKECSDRLAPEFLTLEKLQKSLDDAKTVRDRVVAQNASTLSQIECLEGVNRLLRQGTTSLAQYLDDKRAELKASEKQLAILKESCNNVKDDEIRERRAKLALYQDHNAKLEADILALGGANEVEVIKKNIAKSLGSGSDDMSVSATGSSASSVMADSLCSSQQHNDGDDEGMEMNDEAPTESIRARTSTKSVSAVTASAPVVNKASTTTATAPTSRATISGVAPTRQPLQKTSGQPQQPVMSATGRPIPPTSAAGAFGVPRKTISGASSSAATQPGLTVATAGRATLGSSALAGGRLGAAKK